MLRGSEIDNRLLETSQRSFGVPVALCVIFRKLVEVVIILILTNPYFYDCRDRGIAIYQASYP